MAFTWTRKALRQRIGSAEYCGDMVTGTATSGSASTLVDTSRQEPDSFDKDLAQEIKAREPWAIVQEHEREGANKAMRGHSMIPVARTWPSAPNSAWVDMGNGRWVYRPQGQEE